jgi:primosomal protein N'
VAGSSEQKTAQLAQTLKALLGKSLPSSAIMGGSWAPVKKVRGKFRQQIILKGNDLNLFREAIKRAISELGRDLAIIVDVDPMFLF